MRWPWQRREKRDSGGDFSDAVVRLIEAQAAGTAADASSTAAVEAASGALSRAFASAEVVGEPWVQESVSPVVLGQIGRDLIRSGDSLHVIRVGIDGMVQLIPCSSWHWEGNHDPDSWTVRATAYGPSTSTTWNLPASAVVFVRWGGTPGQPYVGTGPLSWAHTTARLQSEAERSLADEAQGPLAQLIAVPQDGGDDGDDDPLKMLKADIRGARGKALLLETSAAALGRRPARRAATGLAGEPPGADAARVDGNDPKGCIRGRPSRVRNTAESVRGLGRHGAARGRAPLAPGDRATTRPTPRARTDGEARDRGSVEI